MSGGFQLLGVHGADNSSQNSELGQGSVFSQGVGLLDFLSNLLSKRFDSGHTVNLF